MLEMNLTPGIGGILGSIDLLMDTQQQGRGPEADQR